MNPTLSNSSLLPPTQEALPWGDRCLSPDSKALFRQQLKLTGFLYLRNLPSQFDWLTFAQELTYCQLQTQDNDALVADIRQVPGYETQSDSKSRNGLRFHSEAPYLAEPPQFLALWGVHPSRCGGGYTLFADLMDLFRSLTEAELQHLRGQRHRFVDSRSRHCRQVPLLELLSIHQWRFRFSLNTLLYGHPSPELTADIVAKDLFLLDWCDRIVAYTESCHTAIRIEANSLLILDNWRCVHARTAYDDPARHLRRIWLG